MPVRQPMLKLYNTLTKQKEVFTPLSPDQVTLYTCGPTVYNYAHIGNLRTYIFEDVLKRTLIAGGYTVNHVMNITDVGHLVGDADSGEDKMERQANGTIIATCKHCGEKFPISVQTTPESYKTLTLNITTKCKHCGKTNKINKKPKKNIWNIAQFYTDAFQTDLRDLNILDPTTWCKATDYIPQQIEMIQQLEAGGHTYKTRDGVYFDTTTINDYGKLAGLDIAGLDAGKRVDMGEKKHSTDFALWKFSPASTSSGDLPQRQMEWESPWGTGFPGWHIECSAMIRALLGDTIDIHCGGIDHVPVHHTNEIAQSESATGKPLARTWLHGEFLLINDGRMGKSEGNFITLDMLKEKGINPIVYRLFVLTAHYRSKLNFTDDVLIAEEQRYTKIMKAAFGWGDAPGTVNAGLYNRFLNAINDDLNTAVGLAIMEELLQSALPASDKAATLYKMDEILGLGIQENKIRVEQRLKQRPIALQSLIQARAAAKQEKNYALADKYRDQIVEEYSFEIEDQAGGGIVLWPTRI